MFTKKYFQIIILLCLCSFQVGCVKKIAARASVGFFKDGMEVFFDENDPEIAKIAFPGNFKIIESFLQHDPYNTDLLLMMAKGFVGYNQLFLELDYLEAMGSENDEQEAYLKERMMKLYRRAAGFSIRALRECDTGIADLFQKGTPQDFENAVASSNCLDGLFWYSISLLGQMNLDLSDIELMSEAPKLRAAMARVLELDAAYFFASPQIFFGGYYCKLPKMIGGDPEKGLNHFKEANKILDNGSLFVETLSAEYYWAIKDLDKANEIWDKVMKSDSKADKVPTLINEVAKRRAFILKKYSEELF